MVMGNMHAMGCPRCSNNKSRNTHTYATYRIYVNRNNLKLICKTCYMVTYFKFIDGGASPQIAEEDTKHENTICTVQGYTEPDWERPVTERDTGAHTTGQTSRA